MSDYQLRYVNQSPPPRSKNPPPEPEQRSGCWRVIGCLGYLFVFTMIVGLGSAAGVYYYLSNELSGAINAVVAYQGQGAGGTPRFYDRNGTLIFELPTVEKRKWLAYADMPEVIKQATVAVEDDTFWENPGFDPAAIGAAVLYNYQNQDGRPVGASTITQQLVRHIAFDYQERVGTSYERKIREIFLAAILTRQRPKEDILTMYLNEIYYGNLAYGIEAAAQTYFGKSATNLHLAEAAFLAGLPQAPIQWDPYTNFEGAKARQEIIIDLMQADGVISETDALVAKSIDITLRPLIVEAEVAGETVLLAPHFVLYVQNELAERYGANAVTRGGWQVTTTLDLGIFQAAEQALRDQVADRAAKHNVSNGAAVVLKPSTSEILAMVGSLDYFNEEIDGQFNMALAPRQPGSSFKPITYVAAMEKGWSAADVLWDVPIELEVGFEDKMTPVNYDGRYRGPITFRDALANSYNIPPLQLAREIGIPYVIQTGRKMGLRSLNETPGYYGLSLTLGGGELPLVEMTHAFSTLANEGKHVPLTSVLEIRDSAGNLVYDAKQNRPLPNQVVDPAIAYIITDILDDDEARVSAMGRGSALELPFPAAGKTGTTNDFRDNLTIGYTPGVVVGIWLGNTDNRPMVDSSGLFGAAPVWARIISEIYADGNLGRAILVDGIAPPLVFNRPGNIEAKTACLPQGTGGSTCTASREELFVANGNIHGIGRIGYTPDVRSVPGAWVLNVLPMPADAAQQVNLPALDNGFAPPPPRYCVINSTNSNVAGLQTRILLPMPSFYPDEVRARLWLERYGGYQMAPPIACPINVARAGGSGGVVSSGGSSGGSTGSGAASNSSDGRIRGAESSGSGGSISSPAAGAQLSGSVPIMGTADVAGMQYYKLEISGGANPGTWTTFGTTHSQAVNNGQLEILQAGSLPAGEYVIRLVVVMEDGNFSSPASVPVTIAP